MRLAHAVLYGGIIFYLSGDAFAQSSVKFQATYRLPGADGVAVVTRRAAGTRIDIKLNDMKPAGLFGGDYATYIFWAVAPDGRAINLGEFRLTGDESALSVTTTLAAFGMLITAEPHYLVSAPSRFVVMEDPPRDLPIEYRGYEGRYHYSRDTLAGSPEADAMVHTGVHQAFTAVRLAQRAGANKLAKHEMDAADNALDLTFNLSRQGADRLAIEKQARETVRLAVAAEGKAREEEIAQLAEANREAHAQRKRDSAKE